MGKSREELQDILTQLSDQLFRAWSAFLVAKHVDQALHSNQVANVHYFLIAIYGGCTESAILALSKLAARNKDSIHIEYMINCCEQSPDVFVGVDEEEVLHTVREHKERLKSIGSLVGHVRTWRNQAIAHLDRKYVNDPESMSSLKPIDMEQVEESFVLFQEIINAYRGYLGSSLIRLDSYEAKMAEEWECLMALVRKDNEAAA